MKKIVKITAVILFVLVSTVYALTQTAETNTLKTSWIHVTRHDLSNPYFILRKADGVCWGTNRWRVDEAFTICDIRPTQNTHNGCWVFTLPQDAAVTPGYYSLTLYDAANGSETITDESEWGGIVLLENNSGKVSFATQPMVF